MIGNTPVDNNTLVIKVLVSLKCFNNSWRYLNFPLIYREIELDLSWSRKCIISQIHRTPEILANSPGNLTTDCVPPTLTSDAVFQKNSTKVYLLVVTLSIKNNIKFVENLKEKFKRTTSWKKYRSERTAQSKKQQFGINDSKTFYKQQHVGI